MHTSAANFLKLYRSVRIEERKFLCPARRICFVAHIFRQRQGNGRPRFNLRSRLLHMMHTQLACRVESGMDDVADATSLNCHRLVDAEGKWHPKNSFCGVAKLPSRRCAVGSLIGCSCLEVKKLQHYLRRNAGGIVGYQNAGCVLLVVQPDANRWCNTC